MKTLMKFFKPYWKTAVLAPLFKMLEAFFELFVPLVMTHIIDDGIGGGDKGVVIKMGLVLLALAAVGLVASVTAQYFSARTAVGFAKDLKSALFRHINSFSFAQLDIFNSSTLITRLTGDVNQVQTGVNMTLRLFLRSPFIVFGAMIMAFTINVKCALIFCVVIPVLSALVFGIMLGTMPGFRRVRDALDTMIVRTRENLSGVRVIRAFNMQTSETEKFGAENDEFTRRIRRVSGISALMNPVTFVVVNVALVVMIKLGALSVFEGVITQGELIAIINYMSQILVELIKLADLIILITKSFASAKRIEEVFAVVPEAKGEMDVTASSDILADIKDVSFKYSGAGDYSLKDISFSVKRGDHIGIIGGTGSGKTTLVSLIPDFYHATEGAVLFNGTDVKYLDKHKVNDSFGFVFQNYYLIKGTIRDNIVFGAEGVSEEDIVDALKRSQSYDFVMSKQGGLDAKVEERGANFSGGQKQRLMIARALVRHPDVLVLDDSSSALDYATDRRLRKALTELKNVTVFIVSQRTSAVRHCDRIIVLEDGRAAGIGTHDELLETSNVYREIYESQINR